jgi:uncharacterized protein
MGSITVHEYKKKDLSNAMVVISFPTVGLVSTIAANFLVSNLKLELVAAFSSDDFYPAAIIQDGVPMPPVRVYAGDHVCGPKGSCEQLVVITSELPIRTASFSPLAERIIQWCRENRCHIVVTLEGVNSPEPPNEPAKVFHVGSNEEALSHLKGLDTEPLNTGMVSGLSGILLYKGNIQKFGVACLLAQAHADFPDSRSAARLLTVLHRMVPQIEIDPQPLMEQAKVIEDQVRKAMAQIKPMAPAELPDVPPGMYR